MSIKFDHVSYTYSPKTPYEFLALKDISFEIKDNSFTCIVGHTGCGKSTLIQHLNGLLIPTDGKVFIDDFEISKKHKNLKKLHDIKKKVGIVFQFSENQLFDDTVEQDVAFGPINFGVKKEEALEKAHRYLELVGIGKDYYKKSPLELSGGEKRRVALAGILAIEPKILVLDEPTVGLDPKGSKEMLELFKKLNDSGVTIVLVTHDINLVFEYASDVIVMKEGRVELMSTPNELFKNDVEKYSLDIPFVQKILNLCKVKGIDLTNKNIRNIDQLAKELARLRK